MRQPLVQRVVLLVRLVAQSEATRQTHRQLVAPVAPVDHLMGELAGLEGPEPV